MIFKNDLIEHLINSGVLYSNNLIRAFENIDRADFVRDITAVDIYEDFPLAIGHGQTISQPSTVALMLEMLEPKTGEKILDIGSGSGWTTALLAFVVGERGFVIGMERISELVNFGSSNLKKYSLKNAKIVQAGDELGVVGEKFDRILVSAAADKFPFELLKQLNVGGKLVIPIQNSIFEVTKKQNGELDALEHYGFTFVPLVV